MDDALLSLLRIARTHAERSEYRQALTTLAKALRVAPQSAHVWLEIGYVLTEQGETEEALDALDHAVHLLPTFAAAHFQRGLVLGELGRSNEARGAFGRSIELKPDFDQAAREALAHSPSSRRFPTAPPQTANTRPVSGIRTRGGAAGATKYRAG